MNLRWTQRGGIEKEKGKWKNDKGKNKKGEKFCLKKAPATSHNEGQCVILVQLYTLADGATVFVWKQMAGTRRAQHKETQRTDGRRRAITSSSQHLLKRNDEKSVEDETSKDTRREKGGALRVEFPLPLLLLYGRHAIRKEEQVDEDEAEKK